MPARGWPGATRPAAPHELPGQGPADRGPARRYGAALGRFGAGLARSAEGLKTGNSRGIWLYTCIHVYVYTLRAVA